MKKYARLLIIIIITNLSTGVVANAQTAELDSLYTLLEQHTEEDTTRVLILNQIAKKLYRIDTERTLEHAAEAADISARINYLSGEAQGLNIMGLCDESQEQALIHLKKALKIFEKLNDKKGANKCNMNIGVKYRRMGNYPKALEYYHKSLKISEEIGDKKMLAGAYNNIGIVYRSQGDYPQSLEYYKKSLAINETFDNEVETANCINNIGVVYEFQENYDTALIYFNRALELYIKAGPFLNDRVSTSYHNIALVYLKKKAYSKANEYYQKSLSVAKEVGGASILAYAYSGLAHLALNLGNMKEAYDYSKKAYQLSKKTGNIDQIMVDAEVLARSSSALGYHKEAYDYHVVFKEMSDSIFNESNIKKITELEYQYKYEEEKREAALIQKQKDALRLEREERQQLLLTFLIVGFVLVSLVLLFVVLLLVQKHRANQLLASQKDEIDVKNDDLKELNATKDKFFSIISHDLKSPFNAILGFSSMLLAKHNSFDPNEREEAIKYVNTSAESAFKLLENLLTWSKSQSGKMEYSPQRLNLSHSVSETIEDLQGQADEKEVTILNKVSNYSEVFADKNMLSMILRNLTSNALKFTHKGGQVSVKAERRIEDTLVSVSDTGVGISEEILSKLFTISENISTKGTNNEKGTGLGLILCKEFVEQHGGTIWAESEVGKGTTFYFTIPTK